MSESDDRIKEYDALTGPIEADLRAAVAIEERADRFSDLAETIIHELDAIAAAFVASAKRKAEISQVPGLLPGIEKDAAGRRRPSPEMTEVVLRLVEEAMLGRAGECAQRLTETWSKPSPGRPAEHPPKGAAAHADEVISLIPSEPEKPSLAPKIAVANSGPRTPPPVAAVDIEAEVEALIASLPPQTIENGKHFLRLGDVTVQVLEPEETLKKLRKAFRQALEDPSDNRVDPRTRKANGKEFGGRRNPVVKEFWPVALAYARNWRGVSPQAVQPVSEVPEAPLRASIGAPAGGIERADAAPPPEPTLGAEAAATTVPFEAPPSGVVDDGGAASSPAPSTPASSKVVDRRFEGSVRPLPRVLVPKGPVVDAAKDHTAPVESAPVVATEPAVEAAAKPPPDPVPPVSVPPARPDGEGEYPAPPHDGLHRVALEGPPSGPALWTGSEGPAWEPEVPPPAGEDQYGQVAGFDDVPPVGSFDDYGISAESVPDAQWGVEEDDHPLSDAELLAYSEAEEAERDARDEVFVSPERGASAAKIREPVRQPVQPPSVAPKRLRLDKNVLGRDLDFSIPPGVDKFPSRVGGPIYPPPGALRTR